ncbi:unnamed protein product [Fusarium equiseti]|uniref:TIL domain-containing protein n=1 Tax=Fusarium equiseti TaxID=61235 RepID=A0A8J2IXN0_FUSEQ|nr:unnamed protein product [Fusarium equiseti]
MKCSISLLALLVTGILAIPAPGAPKCPPNKKYNECGTACPKTCTTPEGMACTKQDQHGIWCLGQDGVLKHFDATIRYRLRFSLPTDVSEWNKWHPAQSDIPRILTEEERAKKLAAREEFKRLNPNSQCRKLKAVEEK